MLARPARLALPLVIAAALVSGCGGSDVAYEEIELSPPALTIPEDSGTTAAAGATATPTATATATATADAGTGAATGGGTTPETTTDSGTTGGTTPAQEDTTTEPGNTGGTTADGLDQFCADNPGACDGE